MSEENRITGISFKSEITEAFRKLDSRSITVKDEKGKIGLPELPGNGLSDAAKAADDGVVFDFVHILGFFVISHRLLKFLLRDDSDQ